MKVVRIRDGERFVLDDRGGVWEKIGEGENKVVKARCVFGPRDAFGTEIELNPNVYCYVMFEGRDKPFGRKTNEVENERPTTDRELMVSGTTIQIINEDTQDVLREIKQPTMAQITVMSAMETLRMIPNGSKHEQSYHVSEFAYDLDKNVFYLLVMREGSSLDDENDKHVNQDEPRRIYHNGRESNQTGRREVDNRSR